MKSIIDWFCLVSQFLYCLNVQLESLRQLIFFLQCIQWRKAHNKLIPSVRPSVCLLVCLSCLKPKFDQLFCLSCLNLKGPQTERTTRKSNICPTFDVFYNILHRPYTAIVDRKPTIKNLWKNSSKALVIRDFQETF